MLPIPTTLAGVPVNKFPVKEFVDCIKFLVKTGNVVKDVTDPDSPGGSGVSWLEYPKFLSLIGPLKDAIVGIGQVPYELGDTITSEEKADILAEVLLLEYISGNQQAEWYIDKIIKWLTLTQEIVIGV